MDSPVPAAVARNSVGSVDFQSPAGSVDTDATASMTSANESASKVVLESPVGGALRGLFSPEASVATLASAASLSPTKTATSENILSSSLQAPEPTDSVPPVQSTLASTTFIGQTISKVPVLGGRVAPLLECRVLQPITNFADPYVESGVKVATPYVAGAVENLQPYFDSAVQKAQPYAQPLMNRAQPYVDKAIPAVQALPGQIAAVPGQVIEGIKAAPGKVYNSTMDAATSTAQTVAAVPGQIYHGTVNRVSSTVQTVKALPGHVKSGVAYTTDSIMSAPGKAYQTILDRSTPIAQSAAQIAQPYVHKGVGIITPYVESTLTSQRVQSLYQSRLIQGSIEKATPFVEPVAKHPRVKAVVEPVVEWARPRAATN